MLFRRSDLVLAFTSLQFALCAMAGRSVFVACSPQPIIPSEIFSTVGSFALLGSEVNHSVSGVVSDVVGDGCQELQQKKLSFFWKKDFDINELPSS